MIETERLRLRPWRETDKPVFHALANTPAMMEHFGGPVPRAKHGRALCLWKTARNGLAFLESRFYQHASNARP